MIQDLKNDPKMIDEVLKEVEKLVNYAMDVVDMAEKCGNPAILY